MKFSCKLIVPVFLALILASIAGCGGGNAPAVIGPAGGVVTSNDSKASVMIPAGALSQQTKITVNAVPSTPTGNIGTAYEVGPSGTTFDKPVTISIAYDPNALPSNVTESSLRLCKQKDDEWEDVDESMVDDHAHEVTGIIKHSGIHCVIAKLPDVPTGLQMISGEGLTIKWNAALRATSYNLYMAPVSAFGYPVSASTDNTEPILNEFVDKNNVRYGSFELDPGEAAFVVTIQDPTETTLVATDVVIVTGTVTVTVNGETVTLTAGQHHTFLLLPNWATVLPGAMQHSGLDCCIFNQTDRANEYFFAVTAVNKRGESAQSSPSWTPVAAGVSVPSPSPPTGLTATPGDGQVTLALNPNPTNENVTSHNLYMAPAFISTFSTSAIRGTIPLKLMENSVPYGSFELDPGEAAFVTNVYKDSTRTMVVIADVAIVSGTVTVTVDGQAITLTGGQHHTFVRVADWTSVLGATQQSGLSCCTFNQTGLTNGTGYLFAVTAVNASGESAQSSPSWTKPTATP